MSRVTELEERVNALEKNVGLLAKSVDMESCLEVRHYISSDWYKRGVDDAIEVEKLNKKRKEAEAQFVFVVGKRVAFRYCGKPIYYPGEHAVFDLHIPAGKLYAFHGRDYVSKGVIRAVSENDIKDILLNTYQIYKVDLIQDKEHPTDLYVVDR